MKKQLLSIVFILFSVLTFAQMPLFNGSVSQAWYVISSWADPNGDNCATIVYHRGDSVTINELDYVTIVESTNAIVGYFRQDGSKYYFLREGFVDKGETLMYDFSLEKGNTFFLFGIDGKETYDLMVASGDEEIANEAYTRTVVEVDSMEIQGNKRKYLLFDKGEKWIEGIGSTEGLLYYDPNNVGVFLSLSCYKENNELAYTTSPDSECECNSTAIETLPSVEFSISPNPVHSTLYLTLPQGEHTVTIYNAAGSPVLKQQAAEPQAQIVVNGLAAGVYFVQVDGGEMLKFVKE